MTGSGSPNAEPAPSSGCTAPPNASRRRRSPTRKLSCAGSCASSPPRRPRWGWRRAAKAARKAGWAVNDKRIRRLWRDEGLRVPQKRRKKRLTGIGVHVGAMCPIRPNVLWALDFQFDTTIDGRTLKLLNVIDEFTRECSVDHRRPVDRRRRGRRRARPARPRTRWGAGLRQVRQRPGIRRARRAPTGAASAAPRACSSTPVRHGRTPGSRASTVAYATSCSTAGTSTASSRPA